mgnify:CR=1 FL=1
MKQSDMRKPFATKAQTQNMTALRDRLLDVFDALGNAAIPPEQAKELANTAGKIINSAKAQLEYAALRKEDPNIPFLK